MKTLDEVIEVFEQECCQGCDKCPYYPDDCLSYLDEPLSDALHYLKKLKRIETKIEKIAIGNVEDTLSEMDNSPLTWDELKSMEGKPVWVEGSAFAEPFWTIITGFGKAGDSEYIFFLGDQYWVEDMHDVDDGLSWQAYRKERK